MMGLNFNLKKAPKPINTTSEELKVPMKILKTVEGGGNLVKKYFNPKLNISYEIEFIEEQDENGVTKIKKLLKNVSPGDLGTVFKLKDSGPLDREDYILSEIYPKDTN